MIALSHGQATETGTVHLDRVCMIVNKTVFAADEIDDALPLINFSEGLYVPVTVRDLLDEFSVGSIVIEVRPAAPVTEPKKRTIFQPAQTIVVDSDPGPGRFPKQVGRLTVFTIRGIQIQKSLFTVLRHKPDFLAVR